MVATNKNIATVNHNKSTWVDKEYTKYYFVSKGALFYACDKILYHMYILYFALTHKRKTTFNLFEILNLMYQGVKKYK